MASCGPRPAGPDPGQILPAGEDDEETTAIPPRRSRRRGATPRSTRSCRRTSSASTARAATSTRPWPVRPSRARHVHHQLGLPGVHGAARRDRLDRRQRRARLSRRQQGIFYTRSQLAKIFGLPISKVRVRDAAGRRLRLEDHGRGAARGRRRAEAPPARPARAHPARGHGHDQPRAGYADRAADRRRRRRGSPGSAPGWSSTRRVPEWTSRASARSSIAGPYRWQAWDMRASASDEPRRHRLLPRAGRAAGGVRARIADRRAGRSKLGIDPIELRASQPGRRAT